MAGGGVNVEQLMGQQLSNNDANGEASAGDLSRPPVYFCSA
jgi:hypothetical protein